MHACVIGPQTWHTLYVVCFDRFRLWANSKIHSNKYTSCCNTNEICQKQAFQNICTWFKPNRLEMVEWSQYIHILILKIHFISHIEIRKFSKLCPHISTKLWNQYCLKRKKNIIILKVDSRWIKCNPNLLLRLHFQFTLPIYESSVYRKVFHIILEIFTIIRMLFVVLSDLFEIAFDVMKIKCSNNNRIWLCEKNVLYVSWPAHFYSDCKREPTHVNNSVVPFLSEFVVSCVNSLRDRIRLLCVCVWWRR